MLGKQLQQKYILLIFNNKMSQNYLTASKPYTRKKIQNFSYGLNDAIGKGYSSQVYKGKNDLTDEPVAVKVIDLKMLKCQINRTLLNSEIQILKSMRNTAHILVLHEVYTTKNNTYIITQLCESDLSKKIKRGLPERDVFRYMDQLLMGYSFIVNNKLIHRDLKPANLLITHEDSLKIADFGFGIKAEEVLKPSKYNVGSPLYMAPESLRRNQYSYKTDIWAIGVIFFQMLTGDTPWRAKNQKELLKKIQNQKIETIIQRKNFSPQAKQFLIRTLNYDKKERIGPEQIIKYSFCSELESPKVLGQKHTNIMKLQKFQSVRSKPSPKNYSAQKRLLSNFNKSQKSIPIQKITQNISMKNIQNYEKKNSTLPYTVSKENNISKDDKKFISKLMISEVHFCRFLFKLLLRIKESRNLGILSETDQGFDHVYSVTESFTGIIKHKIQKLKEFQNHNFLKVQKYTEYKSTSDFKKLMKISQDYLDRYSTELSEYWNNPICSVKFQSSIENVMSMMRYLKQRIVQKIEQGEKEQQIKDYGKDIIILDYLITCKQLLTMILKDGQNYEKFAKKSRIQEIVEGATSEINSFLYTKIIDRAKVMLLSANQI